MLKIIGLLDRQSIRPTTYEITSTNDSQSVLWIGMAGVVRISMIYTVPTEGLTFTVAYAFKNTGTSNVYNISCKYLQLQLDWLIFDFIIYD